MQDIGDPTKRMWNKLNLFSCKSSHFVLYSIKQAKMPNIFVLESCIFDLSSLFFPYKLRPAWETEKMH